MPEILTATQLAVLREAIKHQTVKIDQRLVALLIDTLDFHIALNESLSHPEPA